MVNHCSLACCTDDVLCTDEKVEQHDYEMENVTHSDMS